MQNKPRHFVIGTAGHIDHGKTSLVKNLTGKDTDWLKEEKERGMTIDLGFAFLGDDITIIDVPGHEKFIRNMVAGVSTIDLVLLVIAADDGIMPQTREHLEILNLLQIQQGVIGITKIDLAESDWTSLVIDEVKEIVKGSFLENAPIVLVSNVTGQGVDELKNLILQLASSASERKDKGVFRLPIDRVFTMKGFGTVVAGTVLSGSLTPEQPVELLPQGIKLRIRGLQIHEQKVNRVKLGDRAAINLAGIEKEAVHRGDVLAAPDFYRPTKFFDAKFYLLQSSPWNLKNTARIRLHVGTSEVIGRVSIMDKDETKPGESAYVQFRLEKSIVADVDDRFVIRSYSPTITIGGGRILDAYPGRHRRLATATLQKFQLLEKGDPKTIVGQYLLEKKFEAASLAQISQALSIPEHELSDLIEKMMADKLVFQTGQKNYLHQIYYEQAKQNVISALTNFHTNNPMKRGVNRNDLKTLMKTALDQNIMNQLLEELNQQGQIAIEDNKVALASYKPQIPVKQKQLMEQIAQIYQTEKFITSNSNAVAANLKAPQNEVEEAIGLLLDDKILIKVDEGIIFHRDNIQEAEQLIITFFNNNQELTVGDCRQFLNTSRKYAVPLLNYFDQKGLTVRQHDIRVINPHHRTEIMKSG